MTAEKISLQCHHCAKEFKYGSERRRHEQSHFPQFSCKVCSKNFSFISALRRHEKQHDRSGNAPCEECGKVFRDYTLLNRHMKYAHGGDYRCTKCNTTLSSAAALRSHMKTHQIESERKYQCHFQGCNKSFNFAHHLKHHELAHTNFKQHFCGVCGKGFIQYHHLKTHLKTHDPDLSLYCTYTNCNKKFATEYARKRHLFKYHKKVDSGISSGSISPCETPNPTPNTINCTILSYTTEENYKNECTDHKVYYIGNQNEIQSIPEDLSVRKIEDDFIGISIEPFKENDNSNCKTAIGECIMDHNGEKCVCAQIPDNTRISENFDFAPIQCGPTKISTIKLDDIQFRNPCEGCACSDHCDVPKMISGTLEEIPEMEYGVDGSVKIKETFDVDFLVMDKDTEVKCVNNNGKFVPYNSCRAVLGNCIVSGDGTIGEGCLCAKMALEEQATAQEIEDITPHPKNEL